MTAIQDQDLALRAAAVHFVGEERRGQGGRLEQIDLRILERQVEPSAVIQNAMPREVQKDHVVRLFVAQKLADGAADAGLLLVDQGCDRVEAADRFVVQDLCERLGIGSGRLELGKLRIVVLVVANDQCVLHPVPDDFIQGSVDMFSDMLSPINTYYAEYGRMSIGSLWFPN